MKKITIQEAFSLGESTSFHIFIKDRHLTDRVLRILEEKGVYWNNDKRATKLKEFMDNRVYPVALTVNKRPTGYRMTYADDVRSPSHIHADWGSYPTKGYVFIDEEMLKFRIKRRDKF